MISQYRDEAISNFGAQDNCSLRGPINYQGEQKRVLMQWDMLNTAISSGATITSVTLELFVVDNTPIAAPARLAIYPITNQPWDEYQVSWEYASDDTLWNASGAFNLSDGSAPIPIIASSLTSQTDENGTPRTNITYKFAFDEAGVALVQGWLTGETPNNGLLIATQAGWGVDFMCREAEYTQRPRLVINFTE